MQVYWAPIDTTDWALLAAEHYVVLDAAGQVLMKSSAFEVLPQQFNLRIVPHRWIERVPLTSAEVLKSLVMGLGCLDYFRVPQIVSGGESLGLAAMFAHGFDDYEFTAGGPSGTVQFWPIGSPSVFGLPNTSLPDADPDPNFRFPDHIEDPARPGGEIDPGNFYCQEVSIPEGWDYWITGGDYELTSLNNAGAFIALQYINMITPFARLVENAEILDAWGEITSTGELHHVLRRCGSVTPYYLREVGATTPPSGSTLVDFIEEGSTTPPVGWALTGYDPATGWWHDLGSFLDDDAGSMASGRTRVIRMRGVMQQVASLRDTKYEKYAIYPAFTAHDGVTPEALNPDGRFGFMEGIIKGWGKLNVSLIESGGYGFRAWQLSSESHELFLRGDLLIANVHVRFKLPDGLIREVRLPYGNMPAMA